MRAILGQQGERGVGGRNKKWGGYRARSSNDYGDDDDEDDDGDDDDDVSNDNK